MTGFRFSSKMANYVNPEVIELETFDEADEIKSCPRENNLRVKPIRIIQFVRHQGYQDKINSLNTIETFNHTRYFRLFLWD